MNAIEVAIEKCGMSHERLRVKDRRSEKNLLSSLSEVGQQSPVIVVKRQEDYVVIDGHKRVRALKRLKADVVQVVCWDIDEATALARSYGMNAHGGRNAFEEGWLIETLHREFQWTLGEIGKKLLRSKSWASRRLALVEELPVWLVDDVLQGRIGVHAASRYLLPLARANTPEVKMFIEKIKDMDLTDREMKDLATSYRGAKEDVKKKITTDPSLFLKAHAATQGPPGLNDVESRCVKNLTIIGNICLGLVKNLPEAVPSEAEGQARHGEGSEGDDGAGPEGFVQGDGDAERA